MNLFEINEEIRAVLNEIFATADDETGVVSDDLVARLDELKGDQNAKIENVTLYYLEKCAEADALKAEAKKLTDRARVATNAAERLKAYLISGMNGAGLKKFETARVKLNFRKTSRVVIEDILLLKKEYVKTEISPDKTAIKNALKSGEVVAGAFLEENESLIIK